MVNTQKQKNAIISVIIPCLGHAEALRDCLDALGKQNFAEPFEIIVVDSAGDDAVANVVDRFPNVRLMRSEAKLAPGPARNLGVAACSSEFIAFTDADCQPEPGFLAAAVEALRAGARATTGPVLDVAAGYIPACDNILQFVDFPPSRSFGPAEYAPGCNLALRKIDFLAVGGFPDGGAEDSRFCLQLDSKWPNQLVFKPGMRVRHLGRQTILALLRHHRDFGFQRAHFGVRLTERQRTLARYRMTLPAIILKKMSYLTTRTWKYSPQRLPFLATAFPLLLLGLFAWSLGFREGLLEQDLS